MRYDKVVNVFLLLVLILITGCQDEEEKEKKPWIADTKDSPYEVEGDLTQQVRDDIFGEEEGKGPVDSGGKHRAARTDCEFKYKIGGPEAPIESKEGCECTVKIETIDVALEIKVIFPQWKQFDQASQDCKNKWNTFMTNLKTHEEGHVRICRDGKQTIERVLREKWIGKSATKSAATCEMACQAAFNELNDGVNADFSTELNKINEAQEKYDRDTNFGETQGAVLKDCDREDD
jgi:predicted secreted Zn-dependent protease